MAGIDDGRTAGQDQTERVDDGSGQARAALVYRLAEMVAAANVGMGGLPGLQLIVELAQAATGATGATFVEYGKDGGRIVVGSGEMSFTVGRPVDVTLPAVTRVLSGPPIQELPVSDLGGLGARELAAHGVQRMLRGAATVGENLVGGLQVYFGDAGGRATAGDRAFVKLLAACAAHLYADNCGLPVYEEGPVSPTLAHGVALVGADGLVKSWNQGAERLTTYVAVDAVGRPPPFPMPLPGQVSQHQMPCGRWISIRAVPLVGTDAVAVSLREHTESVAREQARDLFLAVASHELRTPVTVIRGYADTLMDHWEVLDEPTRREAVFVMGQRARELARLVDRLLTAAGDVAGQPNPEGGVPFDVIDTVREVAQDLSPDARAVLTLRLPDALPNAVGDRAGLVTVITELCTNACKYSGDRVTVELTAGADAHTVWVRVADRGVGIGPEHVERAFERFWQLDSGDQRRSGGVGLGLYLARRIVERQGGWVSLRPREGGGTVAEVRLPRNERSGGEA